MASYVARVLMPDEQVIYAATLHWVIYLQGLILTIGGGLLAMASHPIMGYLFGDYGANFAKVVGMVAMIMVVVGIFMLLVSYIRCRTYRPSWLSPTSG